MDNLADLPRIWLRAGAASLAALAAGCASVDPFTDEEAFLARLEKYPTLKEGAERPGEDAAADGAVEQTSLAGPARFTPQAQIFRGRTPASRASGSGIDADSLVLNFNSASIEQAASLILGDFLGAAYEIHPGVSGVINLRSAGPLEAEAALRAFETVLRQNKAALVMDGDLYRIVPEQLALGYAAAPQIGSGRPLRPGYAVQIAPLEFVTAAEMAEILKPLAAPDSVIRIDTQRNLLLLAGSSRELNLWLETIRTFDIDWFAGKSVGVFPLKQVAAAQLVKELEAIFQTANASPNQTIRFLPIERTNSVMAITRAAPLLEKVRDWTARLDADSGASRRLRVYAMKNAKASDVAPLLQEIFDAPAENISRAPVVVPGESTATIDSEGLLQVSTETGAARTDARRPSSAPADTLRIIPDDAANTLLMLASQEEYARIEEALRKLDVAPLQVLVEATIVEVMITDELRYGVQYFLEGTLAQEEAVATLSSAASSVIAPTFPGFSLVLGEPSKIILDALEGITNLNVISSPNLMVLDNQTARLVVGDQIPVTVQNVTNGFTTGDAEPVIFNSIEFRDTGVIFEVTPRISSDGSVTLDILQEVSNVRATSNPTLTPTISQRRIDSSVVVQSGQTIVLGGLFSDRETRSRSGLPILSRAPLFGGLFSNTTQNDERTELVVLIQPRIVKNEADAKAITREFQDRVTGLQLLSQTPPETGSAPAPGASPGIPAPAAVTAPKTTAQAAPPAAGAAAASTNRESGGDGDALLGVLKEPPITASVLPALGAADTANGARDAASEATEPTTPTDDIGLRSVLPTTPVRLRGAYFVQLGAFEQEDEALALAREVKSSDVNLVDQPVNTQRSGGLWRTLAGPYTEEKAQSLCGALARPCAVIAE